jgi:flagellar hook-associated protein 3 FlgL
MNRISTYNQFFGASNGVANGQRDMAIAQRQASSQKVAQDLKGFGEDAGRLVSAKSHAARLDARAQALKTLEARAEVEASALSAFSGAVGDARDAIQNAIANQNAAGLRTALESALATAFLSANVQYAGQSIFGGEAAYEDPVVADTLDALALQPNTDANWRDTGANRTVVLEEGRAIELSESAEEVFRPFVDFLRDLRAWENANGALQGRLTPAQQTHLQSLIPTLSTVHAAVIDAESMAGTVAKQIETAIEVTEGRRDVLLKTVGDQENVDLAEVAARLSAAETQYQASAAIFGRMRDMNLLQYLP